MQSKNSLTSTTDVKNMIKLYKKWLKALNSQDFFDYIEKKCYTVLYDLTGTLLLQNSKYSGVYMDAHNVKATKEKIVISNDAMISLSQILAEDYT